MKKKILNGMYPTAVLKFLTASSGICHAGYLAFQPFGSLVAMVEVDPSPVAW